MANVMLLRRSLTSVSCQHLSPAICSIARLVTSPFRIHSLHCYYQTFASQPAKEILNSDAYSRVEQVTSSLPLIRHCSHTLGSPDRTPFVKFGTSYSSFLVSASVLAGVLFSSATWHICDESSNNTKKFASGYDSAKFLPSLFPFTAAECFSEVPGPGGRKNADVLDSSATEEYVSNWSGNHEIIAKVIHKPETLEEVLEIVRAAHDAGTKLRPIGSGISPNGIAFSPDALVNLAFMDKILEVDQEKGRVRVQAGARVEQVVDALRPYNLTLQNYASVREQQIGGFIQVGAHGTGAGIPPVDEQVLALSLVSPSLGLVRLDLKKIREKKKRLWKSERDALAWLRTRLAERESEGGRSERETERQKDRDGEAVKRLLRCLLYGNRARTLRTREGEKGGEIFSGWCEAREEEEAFFFSRCALGLLGVVADVTLQCVPRHQLLEETFLSNMEEVRRNHRHWLAEYQHLRYMWIPYTNSVVVVCSNPLSDLGFRLGKEGNSLAVSPLSEEDKLRHVRDLYVEWRSEIEREREKEWEGESGGEEGEKVEDEEEEEEEGEEEEKGEGSEEAVHDLTLQLPPPSIPLLSDEQLLSLSFTQLRDALLSLHPLSPSHVRKVNEAEEKYWSMKEGLRSGWSDEILGFDCGGQQWVSEIAFPLQIKNSELKTKDLSLPGSADVDLDFMERLLGLIERENICAPAPLEQRWSCGSRSPMSPAYFSRKSPMDGGNLQGESERKAGVGEGGEGGSGGEQYLDRVYSWVGIILYLPTNEPKQRHEITKKFSEYKYKVAQSLWEEVGATEHWAKIEIPEDYRIREWLKALLQKDYPLTRFNSLRRKFDEKNILSNTLLDELLPSRSK